MNRTTLLLAVCAALVAANVVAEVSQQYRDWGNGPASYLMTKQEKIDWSSLRSDADAKAFIDLFWARRDPTPDTPANELRQEFEARMAEADKRYRARGTPGFLTDRGLVYVLLGQPTQIVNDVIPPRAPAGSIGVFERPRHIEAWLYKGDAAGRAVGTESFDVYFKFQDDRFAGEYEFDGSSRQAFDTTALAVAKRVLKRPFLTAADLASGGAPRVVPLRMIVVADGALARDLLRRAQEGENFADLARKYSAHPSAQKGGYLGRVPFADLDDDFKAALAGKEPGAAVLITRNPQFAIVRLLTESEATAADAEGRNLPK